MTQVIFDGSECAWLSAAVTDLRLCVSEKVRVCVCVGGIFLQLQCGIFFA